MILLIPYLQFVTFYSSHLHLYCLYNEQSILERHLTLFQAGLKIYDFCITVHSIFS